jgi:GT2 family glycosyltransferase
MSEPLVSILTVQYQQFDLTLQFLESISQIEYQNFELIVVDNGSEKSGQAEIQRRFPKVQFIQSEKNLGFAGGNNLGLESCKGEFILFINNDTEVEPDFLTKMIHYGNRLPNLGMMSPRIQYYHPKGVIQYAGSTELNTFTLRNRSLGYGEVDRGQYSKSYSTAYVHGAGMLVPKTVIDQVGKMENDFFLYYEEYDWCARIKKAGYEIHYCGQALIYHKESMSVGKTSALKTFYMTRNRIWFALRNIEKPKQYLTLIFLYCLALPKQILLFILKNRFDLVHASWRGMWFKQSEYENRNRSTADI